MSPYVIRFEVLSPARGRGTLRTSSAEGRAEAPFSPLNPRL